MNKEIDTSLLPKLYVVGGSYDYANYLLTPNDQVYMTLTHDPEEADIAMFTGGEDVDPATYNEPAGSRTHFTRRDAREILEYQFFRELEIPMIGICRGLQFFAAMEGGRLIQHSNGHAGGQHKVLFEAHGLTLPITSAHHQMVDPTRLQPDWEIIGISDRLLSKTYLDGDDTEIHGVDTEIECMYIPKAQALGIQGHPEWMDSECQTVRFWRDLIKEKLL